MPPEWLPTTSAPPGGKASRPCTSDRKYVFKIGRITPIMRSVKPGSNLPMSPASGLSVSLTESPWGSALSPSMVATDG